MAVKIQESATARDKLSAFDEEFLEPIVGVMEDMALALYHQVVKSGPLPRVDGEVRVAHREVTIGNYDYYLWVVCALSNEQISITDFDVTAIDTGVRPASLSALRSRLLASLVDEPLEDGVSHPAEEALEAAARGHASHFSYWLTDILSEVRPATRASIIQCLGRLACAEAKTHGERIVISAISSADVEVREAAVSVIEHWGSPALVEALRQHTETVHWLNDYGQSVLADFD